MLKKAASGVLAMSPCSRTVSTLRASTWLRPCWTDFFDHSRLLLIPISSRACMGHVREIFNRLTMELSVEMLNDERREGVLIKYKWGLARLLPEGIDGFKNFRMLNQLLFQTMLAGEVDKENP
jgi:hypothetical protein